MEVCLDDNAGWGAGESGKNRGVSEDGVAKTCGRLLFFRALMAWVCVALCPVQRLGVGFAEITPTIS